MTKKLVKCGTSRSIQIGFSLLKVVCQANEKYFSQVIEELRQIQQKKYWRNSDMWNVNVEVEHKSPTGYVGMDNPGCICYLNSFIQTLFVNR